MTYKVFANGNPLQASEINLNLMQQAIAVFTDATAREAAIAVPVNGQFAYLTGTSNLTKYTGAAWENAIADAGDITGVIAGTALTGGGTTGDVTLNVDTSQFVTADTVTTAGDLILADGASSVTRLGIGAADTILTSDGTNATWQAPADSGNYTLIASGTLSSESLIISSIPGTYDDLIFVISLSESCRIRINNISTTGFYESNKRKSDTATNILVAENSLEITYNATDLYAEFIFRNYAADGKKVVTAITNEGDFAADYLFSTTGDVDAITEIRIADPETGSYALYGKKFV